MKRRRNLLLLALVVVAGGMILGWPRGPSEPVYEGRRLSEWLEDASYYRESPNRVQAQKAIRALGTNALPYLLSELNRPKSKWHAVFDYWSGQHTQSGFQFTGGWVRNVMAAEALRLLGPDVAPALPELARRLGDSLRGGLAAQAMSGAGELAIPHFVEAVGSSNPNARVMSVYGLSMLTKDTEAAIHPLVQLLQSSNLSTRLLVAEHLRYVQFRPEVTIPSLSAALSDPDAGVRNTASASLAIMRQTSSHRAAELHRLMQGTNAAVALTASNALHLLQSTNLPPSPP